MPVGKAYSAISNHFPHRWTTCLLAL